MEKNEELTLLLLYLNAWEEDGYTEDEDGSLKEVKVKRSWKGYDFETLNSLKTKNFLSGGYKSKSVSLTKEGEQKAKELCQKYFGRDCK